MNPSVAMGCHETTASPLIVQKYLKSISVVLVHEHTDTARVVDSMRDIKG